MSDHQLGSIYEIPVSRLAVATGLSTEGFSSTLVVGHPQSLRGDRWWVLQPTSLSLSFGTGVLQGSYVCLAPIVLEYTHLTHKPHQHPTNPQHEPHQNTKHTIRQQPDHHPTHPGASSTTHLFGIRETHRHGVRSHQLCKTDPAA